MEIEKRIDDFLALDYRMRLDLWQELLSIGKEYLNTKEQNKALAKKIAEAIYYHRSLMGSSKAYESATEIDIELCEISTPLARIAYGKTKPLIDFLKAELYYSNYKPERFSKEQLEREISEISVEN